MGETEREHVKQLEEIIVNPETKDSTFPLILIRHLMESRATCGITGSSGARKNTVMTSMLNYIDTRFPLRVLENTLGLDIRKIYPGKKVVEVTEDVFLAQDGDAELKKVNKFYVNVLFNIDAALVPQMIKTQTEDLSTLFTHNYETTQELLKSLCDSLYKSGGYDSYTEAERTVAGFLDCDIRVKLTPTGVCYVERVTEVIYREGSFITQDLIRYDVETSTYVLINQLSEDFVYKLALKVKLGRRKVRMYT